MPITTNLNISPYFDDFDEANKYYRILFKPGYALQARELTQLQTTLQNQIEQFGDNIYKEGSIIRGCNFTELTDLKYVKLTDAAVPTDFLERTVEMEDGSIREYYYEVVDSNDLRAVIITASNGLVSRNPDLDTIFIRYLNSSDAGIKEFSAGATLTVEEYYIETDTNGDETIVGPTVGFDTTVTVANSLYNPVGDSFGLTVSEGIIYQLGHFLYVDEQTVVVSKYIIDEDGQPIEPNDRSCGFIVDETIVTSQVDSTLNDNATGSPNEQAPGADRLMLVPRLVAMDTDEADADSEFFTLIRYQNGEAVMVRDVTQYAVIGDQMANRTFESQGDFTVKPFSFDIVRRPWTWDHDSDANTADTTTNEITAIVSPGIVYANGYRVENKAERSFRIDDVTDTDVLENQPVSFESGKYYVVKSADGWIADIRDWQTLQILDDANTVIGSGIVRGIREDRIYLVPGTIRMDTGKRFKRDAFAVKDPAGGGQFDLVDVDEDFVESNSNYSGLVYPTDMRFVESVSNYRFPVRNFQTNVPIAANGTITLSVKPNVDEPEIFSTESIKNIFVVANNSVALGVTSAELSGNNLIINTDAGGANTAIVYYNAEIQPDAPLTKQLNTVFVKMHYVDGKTKYTLGLPDVVSIVSITGDDSGTYTDSFVLEDNQHANFYNHSYLEVDTRKPVPADGVLLTVELKVHEVDFTGGGANFFTVDSYVDTDYEDIRPVEVWGATYDLRNCIDFRPFRTPAVAYANTAGGADYIANTATTDLPVYTEELFTSGISYFTPAFDTVGYVDYSYYLARKDAICVDSSGNFTLVTGEASTTPSMPEVKGKTVIAEITVPGYPALTEEEATSSGLEGMAITIKGSKTPKAYTMADIAKINKQVENLTYYTSLTMLEQATKDLAIKDADGLNRFKSGIFVETFDNLRFGRINDLEFDASIDMGEGTMGPAFDTFQLRMKSVDTANTTLFDADTSETNATKVATLLTSSEKRVIAQPYATSVRPVSNGAFRYIGNVKLNPNYSVTYNYWTQPKLVRELMSSTSGLVTESSTNLQKYVSYTSTSKAQREALYTDKITGQVTNRSDSVANVVYSLAGETPENLNTIAGGYVLNQFMMPYMRGNYVMVFASGLRPNTRHYFFFDRQNVTDRVRPAKKVNGKTTPYGAFGNAVKTDSRGRLWAQFKLPGGTFFVGSKYLHIFDVNDWDSGRRTATSRARREYTAYQYGIEKTGATPSLRRVEHDFNEVETYNSVASRAVSVDDYRSSPMAQTFFVKRSMTGKAECMHLSKVNLYFRRKSATNGVRVDIREVSNGYPTTDVLPFSEVRLDADDINVSADGSTATTFTFDAPIRVDVEKEYAIVVTADSDDPDYQIFTSKVGKTDLQSSVNVNQDWGDGKLFSATNGTVWRTYQSEDLKFDLYRYFFDVETGSVTLASNQYEFLTLTGTSGEFEQDELVYSIKDADTYSVTLDANTDTVTSGSSLSTFAVGDWIYINNPSANTEIEPASVLLKVDATLSATSVSVKAAPPWSGAFTARKCVVGAVELYDTNDTQHITLRESSAKSGRILEAANTVIGIDSGASATISSIDDVTLGYGQIIAETVSDSTTDIKAVGRFISPDAPTDPRYSQALSLSSDNLFLRKGGVLLASQSNDVTGAKNVRVRFDLSRISNDEIAGRNGAATPMLDVETATMNVYRYRINNGYTSSWVTKHVHLSEGFEAEDFKLWMTAHRPEGTNIKAYIRVRAADDSVSLATNDWIELEMTEGENLFVPMTNRWSFKEYVFSVPDSAKTDGVLEYTNATGDYSGFNTFAIKIELLSDYDNIVPRISDIRGVAFE